MYVEGLLSSLTRVKKARSLRASSWDITGRNNDAWTIEPNETRVLADIKGPGCINHIWMTQRDGYRNLLLLTRVKKARSLRASSWDTTGKNNELFGMTKNSLVSSAHSATFSDWATKS